VTAGSYAPPVVESRFRSTGMPGYCPWHHLGELDGVELQYHPVGPMGETDFETRTVSLRAGLTRRQKRSTLAHELAHIERGPATGTAKAASIKIEEHLVEATAAVRLIPAYVLEYLPDLVKSYGIDAASGFLVVDERTIKQALRLCAEVVAS
jgi:hypothetical protein